MKERKNSSLPFFLLYSLCLRAGFCSGVARRTVDNDDVGKPVLGSSASYLRALSIKFAKSCDGCLGGMDGGGHILGGFEMA